MAVEKVLPQNLEAEAGVLGSLLIDPEATVQVADFLRPDDFYREAHRLIYQAMLDLFEESHPADLITLTDELARRNKLDEVGGYAYVTSLANQVPTSANAEHYAHIVERTAVLRRLIHAAGQIAAVAYDEPDAMTALDEAERLVFNVSQRFVRSDLEHLRDTLSQYMEMLDQLQHRRGDIVGVATGFSDFDKMTGGLQKSDLIILAARPSQGKCLTATTLIDDPDTGERLTIEECVRRELPTIYGMSTQGRIRTTAVSDWIDSGVQSVFRVRLNSGRVVEVTGHHPFFTVHGWTPLHDLQVGASIAVPRGVPAFGSDESLPLELVRLMAYFIAEGGLTDGSPEFTNTDPAIIEDFTQIIAAHFPACAIRQEKITYIVAQPRTVEYERRGGGSKQPNPLTIWLRDLGLWGKLAKEKSFPACVWTWSQRHLAEFVRILMSCDGSIYANRGYASIEFTVASERLAADLHHALIRFGIVAKLAAKGPAAWRVTITEPEGIQRYQEQIGWFGAKTARFAKLDREIPKRQSNIGHVPREVWELVRAGARLKRLALVAMARQAGETTASGHDGGFNPHMNRSLPQRRLAAYAEVLGDEHLRTLASKDLYWDKIVAIEPFGEQQVYDLTVPDGENFIAQDVLVHNTALALSLAHNAALKFGHTIGFFSLEMSKEQLAARLLSMDAMVDQQRLRLGMLNDDEWDRIGETVGRLSEANIYIDDTPGIRITEMRSKARRLMMEHGCDMLIVDYLQLMQGAHSRGGGENRQQEISEISRGLKGLARELNVPVMALSQLSRAVESRTDKRPQLSDLRESGCLTGESLVFLPDLGISKRIDELVGETGFNVLALNEETWKLVRRPVTNAFATGCKPVYKMTTRLGRSIRATGNHKFLTIEGWKRLDELSSGTHLATPRTLPSPETATMSDAELALLGHLIGDGCTLPRHTLQYTTNDRDLAELVCSLAREVFGESITPRFQQEGENHGGSWYQAYLVASDRLTHGKRNPIAAWLDELGIWGKRAYEKSVPQRVFEQPAASIATFLRHLWVTDGTALYKNGQIAPAVRYHSSSERLARDVQTLLLRLQITARVKRVSQGTKGRDQFHVDVSGQTDQMRFAEMIGTVGERKQTMMEQVVEYHSGRKENTNRDIIPLGAWQSIVEPARVVAGVTTREMQAAIGMAYAGSTLYKSSMSRERALRVADAVHSEVLQRLATSDVYWDEIASIEPDGEAEVYDLTVDAQHCFVSENLIPHNSIEQDADIVMFIYRDEYYNPESEKKNIADIIVAKHRNGPVGDISLYFQKAQTRFRDLDLRTPEPY